MKKIRVLALGMAALCLLCACAAWQGDEYLSVSEHNDPFQAQQETESTAEPQNALPVAENYFGMKAILLSFVTEGVEHGEFLMEHYEGTPGEDLRRAVEYLTTSDPVGAYAIDYMTFEKEETDSGWLVSVDAVYRRSASEIEAIESVRGNARADELIFAALQRFDPSVTLRISGYADEDFEKTIHDYCLAHPEAVIEKPQVSVSIYPESGNVRVVEFHFGYEHTREELRARLSEVTGILSSAANYAHYGSDEASRLSMLYTYLAGRFTYEQDEQATVYSLLCEGVADSACFSAVFAYLCRTAGLESHMVEGAKDGAAYDWCQVKVSGVWYHVDIFRCGLADAHDAELRLDADMSGYDWDREQYPVCDGIPTEEVQNEE